MKQILSKRMLSIILATITLFIISISLSVEGFADDVVDDVVITVPQSCSVQGVIETGGEHTRNAQNNEYYSEIGTTTFKTYCNDNNGSFYAAVYGATLGNCENEI